MAKVSNPNWHRRNVVQIDNDGNILEVATNAKLDELIAALGSVVIESTALPTGAATSAAQASLLAAVEPFSSATPITYTFDAENLAGGSVTAGIPSRKVLLCPAANNTGLVYYGPMNEWINIPVDGPMLISADNPADVKIKGTVVGDVVYVIVYN